jgi:outer membrane protein assembly factor BamB
MSVIPAGSYLVICELSNGDIHHSLELSGVTGPPIVDHNTVFVGTSAGNPKAYAIDLLSGNIIWKHSTNVITTPPSITGSIVVYTDWSGKVYSINVSDGSVRWEFSTKGEFIRSAPVIKSGIVYVCAGTNRTESWVYAFDVEDGEKRWQKHLTDASISASPAADSSKLYVVDDKSRVHALDLITGERQWKTRGRRNAVPRQTVDQSPVVTDSHLYYVTGNQSIMAVSTASGDRHWRKEIQLDVQTSPSLTPEGVILTGAKDIISLCSRSDH